MQIKMKDGGESPEFGPYEAGMTFDETRLDVHTMQVLVDRGIAEEVPAEPVPERLNRGKSALKKEEVADNV